MSEDFTALHKRIVEAVVVQIVKEPVAAGFGVDEVLTVLEGVIVGVMTLSIKPFGDAEVLEMLFRSAQDRLAADRAARLAEITAAGEA